MKELDLIKQFCEKQITNAERRIERLNRDINSNTNLSYMYSGERAAFVKVLKEVQQILKYSVVKPCERRSPTDESFSGCKPPDERQNPQEEKSECPEEYHDWAEEVGLSICPKCDLHI